MSQASAAMPTVGPMAFGAFVSTYLNPALAALLTLSSGSSAPSVSGQPTAYQMWIDTSTTPATLRLYDGAQWVSMGTLDASGHLWRPSGVRERLTASRTYYVRSDGSDSNTGLVDSSGGAFLTIAKALSTAAALDCSTFNVTIQVRSGTWTVPVVLPQMLGSGTFTLTGDTVTPSNVVQSTTSAHGFTASGISTAWIVSGFKVTTATFGSGLFADKNSNLIFNNVEFGACFTAHCDSENGAIIAANGNYSISGGASAHWYGVGGRYSVAGKTITLTGTPAFSVAFAFGVMGSIYGVNNNTFSGSATGSRYNAQENAVIHTNGGGASYLPGNSAGSVSNGGLYT